MTEFALKDDSDFITVRITPKLFPLYGNLVFEKTIANDVLIMRGRIGNGIRMFFADKILNLRLYKEKYEQSQQLPTGVQISV